MSVVRFTRIEFFLHIAKSDDFGQQSRAVQMGCKSVAQCAGRATGGHKDQGVGERNRVIRHM